MNTLLLVIHLLSCFTMVGVILLQSGKGAEMGAAFGGSSQTLFGSRGATSFLSKVTAGAAVVFLLTAISLAVLSKERSIASSIADRPGSPAAESALPAESSFPETEETSSESDPPGFE